MHIVIDARMVGPFQHGIGRHTLNLIQTLERLSKKHHYTLLVNNDFLSQKTKFPLKKIKSKWISFHEHLELPLVLKSLKADVYHSPSVVIPYYCPVPFVVTVHDLIHIDFKEDQRWTYKLYYQTVLKRGLDLAKKIITVSAYTKDRLLKYYNTNEKKIRVIHNGVDPFFRPLPKENMENFRKHFGLPEKFILYIGNSKKHKNIERVLEAYQKIQTNIPLIVAGVSQRIPIPNVQFIPHMNDEELLSLYNLSLFVVCPSLYEGFGFPMVEALACGKTVITSPVTAIPEIVGNAALFVDPYDSKAIGLAIENTLSSKTTEKINEAGIQQAKKFSWEKMTREVMEVHESCYRS